MRIDLDELITIEEPDDLSSCSLPELRIIRERYQEVESALSYIRRIVQGRLDTISVEISGAADDAGVDLLGRLPEALAAHTPAPACHVRCATSSRHPGRTRPSPRSTAC